MKIKIGTVEREFSIAKVWRILYVIFAKSLPRSCYSIVCLKIRYFFTKRIVKYCGKNVNIEQNVTFGEEMEIGENSTIGFNSDIYGPVIIGKNVMIGPELVVYTRNHETSRTDIPMMEQGGTEFRKVVIEDDVWIGRRVLVLPGVTIRKGCIVGAGAVVTKTFPEYSVIAGNPAIVVKSRIQCDNKDNDAVV